MYIILTFVLDISALFMSIWRNMSGFPLLYSARSLKGVGLKKHQVYGVSSNMCVCLACLESCWCRNYHKVVQFFPLRKILISSKFIFGVFLPKINYLCKYMYVKLNSCKYKWTTSQFKKIQTKPKLWCNSLSFLVLSAKHHDTLVARRGIP